MSDNARDTQFQGFASDLWDEIIQASIDGIYGEDPDSYCKKLIARRAYDLVEHTLDNVKFTYVSGIPDMTELPKETK